MKEVHGAEPNCVRGVGVEGSWQMAAGCISYRSEHVYRGIVGHEAEKLFSETIGKGVSTLPRSLDCGCWCWFCAEASCGHCVVDVAVRC